MIDAYLFNELLINACPEANFVIIGDCEQLLSVGPGSVLKDLIDSGKVPATRLKKIYRQEEGGLIVSNAHKLISKKHIKNKSKVELNFDDKEFIFIEAEENYIIETIKSIVLESEYNLNDIMILSPVNGGETGVENINIEIQKEIHNLSTTSLGMFYVSDRVIETKNNYTSSKNNYTSGIMNGEVMEIIEIRKGDEGKIYSLKNEDREIEYSDKNLDQIKLAYAISIHKSQGSEYPIVIIPFSEQNMANATVNTIYTAITRAREKVILAGNKNVLKKLINKEDSKQRNSRIAEKLNN